MLDFTKPLAAAGGPKVRIYATDGGGIYPIHGTVQFGTGWSPFRWTLTGRHDGGDSFYDLKQVVPRIQTTLYANLYRSPDGKLHTGQAFQTKGEVTQYRNVTGWIGQIEIPVDIEEGQTL